MYRVSFDGGYLLHLIGMCVTTKVVAARLINTHHHHHYHYQIYAYAFIITISIIHSNLLQTHSKKLFTALQ